MVSSIFLLYFSAKTQPQRSNDFSLDTPYGLLFFEEDVHYRFKPTTTFASRKKIEVQKIHEFSDILSLKVFIQKSAEKNMGDWHDTPSRFFKHQRFSSLALHTIPWRFNP